MQPHHFKNATHFSNSWNPLHGSLVKNYHMFCPSPTPLEINWEVKDKRPDKALKSKGILFAVKSLRSKSIKRSGSGQEQPEPWSKHRCDFVSLGRDQQLLEGSKSWQNRHSQVQMGTAAQTQPQLHTKHAFSPLCSCWAIEKSWNSLLMPASSWQIPTVWGVKSCACELKKKKGKK